MKSDYLDYAVMVRDIARARVHENLADFVKTRWELLSVRTTVNVGGVRPDAIATYHVYIPGEALFLAANALAADGYDTTLEAGTILMSRTHVVGKDERKLLMQIYLRKEPSE